MDRPRGRPCARPSSRAPTTSWVRSRHCSPWGSRPRPSCSRDQSLLPADTATTRSTSRSVSSISAVQVGRDRYGANLAVYIALSERSLRRERGQHRASPTSSQIGYEYYNWSALLRWPAGGSWSKVSRIALPFVFSRIGRMPALPRPGDAPPRLLRDDRRHRPSRRPSRSQGGTPARIREPPSRARRVRSRPDSDRWPVSTAPATCSRGRDGARHGRNADEVDPGSAPLRARRRIIHGHDDQGMNLTLVRPTARGCSWIPASTRYNPGRLDRALLQGPGRRTTSSPSTAPTGPGATPTQGLTSSSRTARAVPGDRRSDFQTARATPA